MRNKATLFGAAIRPFKLEGSMLVEDEKGAIFRWTAVAHANGAPIAVLEHYGDSTLEARVPLREFLATFTPFERVGT